MKTKKKLGTLLCALTLMAFVFTIVLCSATATAGTVAISGTVRNANSKLPVMGVKLQFYGPSGTLLGTRTTNSNGYYTFSVINAKLGQYKTVATHSYYKTATAYRQISAYSSYTQNIYMYPK